MDVSKSSLMKLSGASNYQVWAIKMRSYLISQDLWQVVDTPLSSKSATSELQSQNSRAMSLIILSCEDHIVRLLNVEELAASAWKKLQKQYGHVGFSARHFAFQSLVSNTLSSCENIDAYIDQFRTHMNTLSQMSSTSLPQWLLLSILINNVGSQYEAWTQSIMQQVRMKSIPEDSQHYLDEVIASLIDEARRVNQGAQINNNTAMTARKGGNGGNGKPKPICKHCGKIHKSENCWQMFPEKRPSGRFPSSNHVQVENQQNSSQLDTIAFLSGIHDGRCNEWIIDSGATQHMCNDKSQFINLETYTTSITTANNTKMLATGRGNVRINPKNGYSFTLQNVLYVPQLASNLISVCCATRNPNIQLNFVDGQCQIMYQKNTIATAVLIDSLLVLETVNAHAHLSKSTDCITWHKRLGHLNKEYMTKDSIKTQIGPISEFTCDVCFQNKSTRNISRQPPIRARRPLERIHSDLAGPMTPVSLGNNKYTVTFTDDYSRYSWVYPCAEKSNCFGIFKAFKQAVENEFNQKIAFLHCDNGGEYSSLEFKSFARKEGFQFQYTVPHSPEQNGVAERLNRTLFNTTRCFLNDTPNLIKPLWAELVNTACYIKNRLPSSSNDGFKSPFEILYGRQPAINHLRIIGSKCYNHKTGKVTGKLDTRATECVLVGYESNNIFRLFDPTTKKMLRARDVVICEQAPQTSPYVTSSNNNHQNLDQQPENFVQLDVNEVQVPSHDKNLPTLQSRLQESQITSMNRHNQLPTLQQVSRQVSSQASRQPSRQPSRQLASPITFQKPEAAESSDESSIDELADPRYGRVSNFARAFVTKCLAASESIDPYLPDKLEQAVVCEESSQWGESMRDEIKSILTNKTWKLVPKPNDGSKVIQGRWVYRTKSNADGQIVKYKSRWVVRGFQQEEGHNYTDTFACVVKPMSYKILFSIAAAQNMDIEQMDVKTAFLNSPINEDVYVEQPHGFEVADLQEEEQMKTELCLSQQLHQPSTLRFPKQKRSAVQLVCKLEKALYGLKQAPRAWYETLSAFLQKCDLEPLMSDYAVFVNPDRTIFFAVYVDDILIFGKNQKKIDELKSSLKQNFEMTDMGPAHMYLGMQITRNRQANTIYLDQKKYLLTVLDRFKMSDCNAVSTPMETGLKLEKRKDIAQPFERQRYQQLIGCLEYAAIATRPDLTFAVHKLAQFASNPDESHFNAAKRVLRYLKGSINYSLIFHGNQSDSFKLIGYSDADWASNTYDRKSIGGYCFYLNHCLISHMSKKQKTIALSTAESETHAAVQATKEAIWLRNILEEMMLKQDGPTTIFCDNQAAIALSRNPEYHSRSKHVDIKYHFLRQHVDSKTVTLQFIGTDQMAADGLTKSLTRIKHNHFCEFMQGKHLQN